MSFLHSHSLEATKSELDLFTVPPTQTSIEKGQVIPYKPFSSISNSGPIEFVVPGHGEDYIDLAHTMLFVKAQILDGQGNPLHNNENDPAAAAAAVGPVNNWLHSLFTQVEVYFNQKRVSPSAGNYAYRAYIDTLLTYGSTAKNSHLGCALWYKDTAAKFSTPAENDGFKKRAQFTRNSQEVELYGSLYCDVFNMNKFLLNEVELRVILSRSKSEFCLLGTAGGNYSVKITDASLFVRKVRLNPKILLSHASILNQTTAKYPLTLVETKSFVIGANVRNKSFDNIYLGQLPKRLVIGFVSNRAYNGDLTLNPFNFQHFNVNFLVLFVDGEQIPSKPLQPDFTSIGQYVQCYHTLFSGIGTHYEDDGNDISLEEYPNGYCLFAFDLTPDISGSTASHWSPTMLGNLRMEIGFSAPVAEAINCMVYAEFDSLIQIDKQRNIIVGNGS